MNHPSRFWTPHALLLALTVLTSSNAAATPRIVTATFLGGAGHEAVRGLRIASDGTIVASLSTYVKTMTVEGGVEKAHYAWTASRIVRLDKDARKVLWDKPATDEILDLQLASNDDAYLLGKTMVSKIALGDGALVGTPAALPSGPIGFNVTPAGTVAVLIGGKILRLGVDLALISEFSHGIQVPFAVLIDRDGGTYVSGDANPGTGCEPYRVPILRHYNTAGDRDWRFYDFPGQLARLEGASSRESDSSIRGLTADPQGRLWFLGWSDGMNTMLSQKVWNPKDRNPFIDAACFPGVCPYPRGARSYMMVARMLDTYDEVGRATWWQAASQRPPAFGGAEPPAPFTTWLEKFPLCGCRPHPYATSTSAKIDGVAFHDKDAVFWGDSDKYAPASADAWFGRIVENGSMFVGILDQELSQGRFGATIPGTSGPLHQAVGDLRGGRLVLAGGAIKEFPARGNPLQATFGGGDSDGFIFVSCLDEATCDGPLPALTPAAAKPLIKPVPPLPELSRCMRGPPLVPAKIINGALPDFGINYSMAPKPSDGGVPVVVAGPVRDAGPPENLDAGSPGSTGSGGDAPSSAINPLSRSKTSGCGISGSEGVAGDWGVFALLLGAVHATRSGQRDRRRTSPGTTFSIKPEPPLAGDQCQGPRRGVLKRVEIGFAKRRFHQKMIEPLAVLVPVEPMDIAPGRMGGRLFGGDPIRSGMPSKDGRGPAPTACDLILNQVRMPQGVMHIRIFEQHQGVAARRNLGDGFVEPVQDLGFPEDLKVPG